MAVFPIFCVFVGAGLGACLRWWLGLVLNPIFPTLPLGTLAANLLGGLLVGVAVAFFALKADASPEVRLFVITGFMGGLTTFSTFSAEVVTLLGQAQFGWALALAGVHLAGSLSATALGIFATRALLMNP